MNIRRGLKNVIVSSIEFLPIIANVNINGLALQFATNIVYIDEYIEKLEKYDSFWERAPFNGR